MIHLSVTMHCNWPSDHANDHSSIGLKRLTMQLVFNEVSLFTFSKGTHGFDVTLPKNYLKGVTNFYLVLWKFSTSQKELLLVSNGSISSLISGGDSRESWVLVCALGPL